MPFAHYQDFEPDEPPPGTENGTKANGHARTEENTKARNGPGPTPGDLAHVWADDITLELDKPGIVDGLLSTTGMTVLYGESGSGKTFITLDLACHVAAGLPWCGMNVEQGVVVYVAAEAPESVKRRIWAWKVRHQVEHLPLVVVTASVDLLNGSTDKLIALLGRIREQHGPIKLVVVDTLARAMTGNENAPDDMGKFVAACGRIREACEGHVLIVHHSGKDTAKGARGHSCLRAATDVELEVTQGDGCRCLTVRKNRDGEEGDTYGFSLETVELGTNAKGRTVITCVATETEAPTPQPGQTGQAGQNRPRPSPSGRAALEALRAALRHKPERPPDHAETRSAKGAAVRLDTWRTYFRQMGGYEDDERGRETERKAWHRGKENITGIGAAKIWRDWAWPL